MSPFVIAIAKAITGAVLAFLTALITAIQSGGITGEEWLTAIVAFIVAGSAVYQVPYNQIPSKGAHAAKPPAKKTL